MSACFDDGCPMTVGCWWWCVMICGWYRDLINDFPQVENSIDSGGSYGKFWDCSNAPRCRILPNKCAWLWMYTTSTYKEISTSYESKYTNIKNKKNANAKEKTNQRLQAVSPHHGRPPHPRPPDASERKLQWRFGRASSVENGVLTRFMGGNLGRVILSIYIYIII